MKKTCPRCGSPFNCQSDAMEQCDCVGAALSDEARERIQEKFNGCLCLRCLRTLKAEYERKERDEAPVQGMMFAPPMHLRGA
ncbi:MAG: cysteine-rich CWC family protein [Gammaproteobacteria bacterium]